MTSAGELPETAQLRHQSILRVIALRVVAYALLFLIVAIPLIDLRSLSIHAAGPTPQLEEPASDLGWPHFRGPTYDAHSPETDIAESWPSSGPPVLWTKEIGAGFSGLIAHGGRVFTQSQSITEQKVLALDPDTGQTLWEHGTGWPYQPGGMFPGPRSAPTLAGGRIYFTSPTGRVGCLSENDGHEVWSLNVVERFDGRGAPFGYACSPLIEDGKFIVPVGGPAASVLALDAATGAVRWASGSAPASYCSAVPITFRGRRQLVVFLQSSLAGFDLQTGRTLWEEAYPKGFEEHAAALLYDEPYLRAFQAYRAGSDLYEIEPGAPGETTDGVPTCRIKRVRHDAQMSNDVASSVLVNGFVYGFDLRDMQANGTRPSRGTFRCMDFKTGQIRWSSDQPGQAAIVVADGKLVMLNDRGQVLLVRVNSDRYEELGRADVFPGETCWTAPALYHGRLLLRSPTRAACLFVGKPEQMTARERASASHGSTSSRTARTDLTRLVGAEREYPFELPDARELTRWYLYSTAALVAAALFAGIAHVALRLFRRQWSPFPAIVLFFLALFVFGVLATPLGNRFSTQFVFTWPLVLIASHQIALISVSRTKPAIPTATTNWVPLIGSALLILTCVIYFKLTRQLALAPAWYFLLTFPIAWPLAIPAARKLRAASHLRFPFLWMFAIFSLYFWATAATMLFRTAHFYHTPVGG